MLLEEAEVLQTGLLLAEMEAAAAVGQRAVPKRAELLVLALQLA